mmetsp:Transcript_38521/g.96498  ORF Transcript_38521/g.96498 Transcript_38521/m.96498 type:complete len:107 (-) Transcript_38521:749-1069(-)
MSVGSSHTGMSMASPRGSLTQGAEGGAAIVRQETGGEGGQKRRKRDDFAGRPWFVRVSWALLWDLPMIPDKTINVYLWTIRVLYITLCTNSFLIFQCYKHQMAVSP